jgi:hypothetical protein
MSIGEPLTDYSNLPAILKATDIAKIMRCSGPKSYDLIREGEAENCFLVRYIGRSPRVPRDSFLNWLQNGNK